MHIQILGFANFFGNDYDSFEWLKRQYIIFPPVQVLKGHDDHVITCLQFSGNRVVSGSDDNTLKVSTSKYLVLCLLRFLSVRNTVKWGNIVIGINIVTSLSYFLTGHNSRTNEFISLA